MYIHIAKKDLGDMCGFDKPQIVCEKMRNLEIEMIFLVIAMYCQASSPAAQLITKPPTLLAGWEGSLVTCSR